MTSCPRRQISIDSLLAVLFDNVPESVSDEQDLWRACVAQAWRDAFGRLAGSETQHESRAARIRAEARRWWLVLDDDRREVLELAGADIHRLERMSKDLIRALNEGDREAMEAYADLGLLDPSMMDDTACIQPLAAPHGGLRQSTHRQTLRPGQQGEMPAGPPPAQGETPADRSLDEPAGGMPAPTRDDEI